MELRVLGPVGLSVDGRPQPIRSMLQRTLLAMLVADANRVVSVDRIVDALWTPQEWDIGHRRVWFHVSKLRGRLVGSDASIERHGPGYVLRVDPDAIDAARFRRLCDDARARLADRDPTTAAALAASALALWRGRPYADVPDDAVGPAERVRLGELRLLALETRLDAELELGRADSMIPELEMLVAGHPHREGLHERLVRALWLGGRDAAALAAFADAREMLAAELGVEPSRRLHELARRITAGASRPSPPQPAAIARRHDEPYGGDAFVGRDRALHLLEAAVRAGTDGGPTIRFVRGQAGAGKTALLRALVDRAEADEPGLLALRVACQAVSGPADPLAPFRDVARQLAGGDGAPRQVVTAAGDDRLARLTVAARAARDVLDAMARHRDGAHGVVDDMVRAMVDAVTSEVPLLLVVDDLHWADAASLDVVGRLSTRARSHLTVVTAYRHHDGGAAHVERLERAVQAASTEGVVIDLDDVTADERRAMVDSLLDREHNAFDEAFRRMLTRVSEGHPLFAVELVEDLRRQGAIGRRHGRWEQVRRVPHQRWPDRINAVVAGRFDGLGDEVDAVLRGAAVEGEVFSSSVVADVVGTTEERVVRLLRRVSETHEVVEAIGVEHVADRRVLRYRFRHNLFQRHVYDTVDPNERAMLHGRVAASLTRLADDDELAVRLARHHEAAGQLRPAAEELVRAAERAIRLGANAQAVAHVRHGLALVDRLPTGRARDELEAELQLTLGNARSITDGFAAPPVEASFERSAVLLADGSPNQRFRSLFGLWVSAVSRADMVRSAALIDELTTIADAAGDDGLRYVTLHTRWTDRMFAGDLGGCLDAVAAGQATYRLDRDHRLACTLGNHDPAVCAAALGAVAAAMRGDTLLAERLHADGVGLAQVVDHHPSHAQITALGAWSAQLQGDDDGLRASAAACLALEREGAVPLWFGVARGFVAWLGAVREARADALESLEEELDRQQGMRTLSWTPMYGSLVGDAYNAVDRPDDALRVAAAVVDPDRPFYASELLRVRAEAHARRDETERATRLLHDAVHRALAIGAGALALRAATSLLDIAPVAGRPVALDVLRRLPPGHRSPLADAADRLATVIA